MTKTISALQARAIELTAGVELTIGRDKGDVSKLEGTVVTINNFDYMTDPEKGEEYVVFTINEDDAHFFFGGMLLTQNIKQLESEGFKEDIEKEGLPTLFEKKATKDKKRTYTKVTFFPAEK